MGPADIKKILEATLESATAIITSEDGRHFTAIVISPVFIGKNRVQKQQLVYTPLHEYITRGTIHAISIKTYTPDEWHSTIK